MTDDAHIGGTEEDGGDSALVAEFALGLLDPVEHERVARRIAAEPALRREHASWRSRFAALDADFAETQPSGAVWSQLERRLFAAQPSAPAASWWNSLGLWRSLAGAATAVAVLAVGFALTRPAPLDAKAFATQLVAAIEAQEDSGVAFVAFYDTGTGAVRLLGLSGEEPADRDYELWYIEGEQPAVSMGVIPVDQRTEIPLDETAREAIGEGTVFAVTLEQPGGSPTGVAQGPVVALGRALAI